MAFFAATLFNDLYDIPLILLQFILTFRYRKALEKNPNDNLALRNVGLVNQKLGKMDEAIEYYKRAVEVDPKYAIGHENLATAYEGKKKK